MGGTAMGGAAGGGGGGGGPVGRAGGANPSAGSVSGAEVRGPNQANDPPWLGGGSNIGTVMPGAPGNVSRRSPLLDLFVCATWPVVGGLVQRVQHGADRRGGAGVGGQGGDDASGGDAGDRDELHVGVVGAAVDAGGGEADADAGGDQSRDGLVVVVGGQGDGRGEPGEGAGVHCLGAAAFADDPGFGGEQDHEQVVVEQRHGEQPGGCGQGGVVEGDGQVAFGALQ